MCVHIFIFRKEYVQHADYYLYSSTMHKSRLYIGAVFSWGICLASRSDRVGALQVPSLKCCHRIGPLSYTFLVATPAFWNSLPLEILLALWKTLALTIGVAWEWTGRLFGSVPVRKVLFFLSLFLWIIVSSLE